MTFLAPSSFAVPIAVRQPRHCFRGHSGRWRRFARASALAVALLCRDRARSDESDLGYRKSYYLEDDHRIHVSTDLWQFDAKINDHVRVDGNVVVDAISGATPLGAPPQKQWPLPTFSDYYNSIYSSVYSAQYSQYIQNNLFYVNAGLESMQQLASDAASFAQGVAGSLATNSALASLGNLSTNRNLHNASVPLTSMHDHRNAFSLSAPLTLRDHQLVPAFSYSAESDYISFGGSLDYSLALNNKNTLLSAGWGHNSDSVRDDQFQWRQKVTDDLFLGVVQLFGPKAYLTFNTSFGLEDGYLADPYRGVMPALNFVQFNPDDPALIPERRPGHRSTELAYISWTQFLTPLNGSAELSYRFFHDSYGISSSTVEAAWHQKLGKHLVLSPRARYAYQAAADFYYVLVPDYQHLPAYFSSDYRLSQMETVAVGLDLTWRINQRLSLDFSYLRYLMRGLDGVTSQSAYPQASVFSFGGRFWF